MEDHSEAFIFASFWERFIAFLIDSFVLSILMVMLLGGYGFLSNKSFKTTLVPFLDTTSEEFSTLQFAILPILALLYHSFFESSKYQATIGKSLIKIKIVDYKGGRASFKNCFVRNVVRRISEVTYSIGHLYMLFNVKRQTVYDLMAKTYVVKNQEK